jgi:hypothetical protein
MQIKIPMTPSGNRTHDLPAYSSPSTNYVYYWWYRKCEGNQWEENAYEKMLIGICVSEASRKNVRLNLEKVLRCRNYFQKLTQKLGGTAK